MSYNISIKTPCNVLTRRIAKHDVVTYHTQLHGLTGHIVYESVYSVFAVYVC